MTATIATVARHMVLQLESLLCEKLFCQCYCRFFVGVFAGVIAGVCEFYCFNLLRDGDDRKIIDIASCIIDDFQRNS